MSFLNLPVLVFGGLFVSVPIVLHLLMRRKPQHLPFPALRFVQRRQQTNQRRFVVKHWALLALRCAAVGGLAFTLARPTALSNAVGNGFLLAVLGGAALVVATLAAVAWQQRLPRLLVAALIALSVMLALGFGGAAWSSQANLAARLLPDQEAPVAAVLLVDTSPRMRYRHANQTRLEAAQELGLWLLKQLPQDSEIAVMDTAVGSSLFAVDRAAAATAIKGLQTSYRAQPIPVALLSAVELLATSELPRRELYVFTDLTLAAWQTEDASRLADALERSPPSLLYLLEVGVPEPRNLSLGLPELSAAHITGGGSLRVATRLLSESAAGERELELLIERRDPTRPVIVDGQPLLPDLTLRDKKRVTADNLRAAWAEFVIRGLDPGLHHGQIRIAGQDGLDVDNVRYFTVDVAEPWRVLVAAPPSATSRFLVDALSPFGAGDAPQALFQCDVVWLDELAAAVLEDYAAVAILDPDELSKVTWEKLGNYVKAGGGLAFFLGRNAQLAGMNQPAAQDLLPGTLARQGRSGPQDLYLSLGEAAHPILHVFRGRATSIPWNEFPVYRYWVFDELKPDAAVAMRFGNGLPVIVERNVGRGRVLTMTTPVSDALQERRRPPWNLLPTAPDSWPYFVLMNETFKYLVHGGESRLNYEVGQTAQISAAEFTATTRYQLFTPQGTWQEVTAPGDELTIRFTDVPGTYRLRGGQAGVEQLGFSVNLPPEATNLERLDPERLDALLGADNFRVARDREDIDRGISEARVGRELYPWTMLVLVLVLGLEHVLANRFYDPVIKPAN